MHDHLLVAKIAESRRLKVSSYEVVLPLFKNSAEHNRNNVQNRAFEHRSSFHGVPVYLKIHPFQQE